MTHKCFTKFERAYFWEGLLSRGLALIQLNYFCGFTIEAGLTIKYLRIRYTYSRVIILFAKKIFSDPTPWLTLRSNKFIKCFFCFKNFLNFLLRIGVLDYWAFTWSILDNLMANKKVLLQSRSLIIRMAIVLRSLTKWPSLIAKKETRSDCLSLIGDYSCLGCGCQIVNSNQFKDHVSLKVPKVR